MERYPIYNIKRFKNTFSKNDLYVNTFKKHLLKNSFIENSHSHNFYLLVIFTKGTGKHKIDDNAFDIKKGSTFLIKPGQVHSWTLSENIDGYIMFYSKNIYNTYFGSKKIEDYPFYQYEQNISEVKLHDSELNNIKTYLDLIITENKNVNIKNFDKIINLIDCIHIDLSRLLFSKNINPFKTYQNQIEKLNNTINQFYKTEKSPSFYANQLNITTKHLNRICKQTLNKTATEVITEKIILESKRLLTFTNKNINETANTLGYTNSTYFSKIFKKNTSKTPKEFRENIKKENW